MYCDITDIGVGGYDGPQVLFVRTTVDYQVLHERSPRLKQLSERDDALRVCVPYLIYDSEYKRCYPGIRNGS